MRSLSDLSGLFGGMKFQRNQINRINGMKQMGQNEGSPR